MEDLLALINVPIEQPSGQEIVQRLGLVESEEEDPEEAEEFYLENRSAGIEIHLNPERVVQVILLYAQGYEGADEYRGPLLHGLTFKSPREEVIKSLGAPAKTIDGKSLAFLGEIGTIDSFLIGDCLVLFQYKVGDDGIDAITLASTPADES